jgi:diaminopimelate decarboxylase
MHNSYQQRHEFYVEDVPVRRLRTVGTPCYIYSYAVLRDAFLSFWTPFRNRHADVLSVKAIPISPS